MVNATCAVCGSTLEYDSQSSSSSGVVLDEQFALTQWLKAHEHKVPDLRARAAIAAFPVNLARASGIETIEDKRRERAVADSLRDADALLAKLKGSGEGTPE